MQSKLERLEAARKRGHKQAKREPLHHSPETRKCAGCSVDLQSAPAGFVVASVCSRCGGEFCSHLCAMGHKQVDCDRILRFGGSGEYGRR